MVRCSKTCQGIKCAVCCLCLLYSNLRQGKQCCHYSLTNCVQYLQVEQTEFIDDVSFSPFKTARTEMYIKRAVSGKVQSAEKLMYICKDQLGGSCEWGEAHVYLRGPIWWVVWVGEAHVYLRGPVRWVMRTCLCLWSHRVFSLFRQFFPTDPGFPHFGNSVKTRF